MRVAAVFVILPIVGAVIGYTTKWVSVQLIFKPARYVGVGPIGWQGVVQRRSPKFAAGVARMLGDVTPVGEILERVDPEALVEELTDSLRSAIAELIPSIAESISPGLWDEASVEARETISSMVEAEIRAAAIEILEESKPVLREDLDLTPMVIDLLSGENADRLARLVQAIAADQLRVVIRYGAVVGFFVGLVEAVVYLTFERWWLLPLIGAIDGMVNNYMGVQMVFRPLTERRYFGLFRYQGLFPARQVEIAHDYAEMIAAEVLTPEAIGLLIAQSPIRAKLVRIATKVLERRLESQLQVLGPMLGVVPTPELRERVATAVTDGLGNGGGFVARYPEARTRALSYIEQEVDLANTIEERLAGMSKLEFEGILRGIFEEDEKILIGIGGVIGAIIGTLQAAIVRAL